jgi:hypothetical protein
VGSIPAILDIPNGYLHFKKKISLYKINSITKLQLKRGTQIRLINSSARTSRGNNKVSFFKNLLYNEFSFVKKKLTTNFNLPIVGSRFNKELRNYTSINTALLNLYFILNVWGTNVLHTNALRSNNFTKLCYPSLPVANFFSGKFHQNKFYQLYNLKEWGVNATQHVLTTEFINY